MNNSPLKQRLSLSRETIRQLDSNRPGIAGRIPRPAEECDTGSYTTEAQTR